MRMRIVAIVLALPLCQPATAAAPGVEKWRAYSNTAMSITGDILLSPTSLVAAGKVFPLRVAADVPNFAGDDGRTTARVLAVTRPVNPKLLHGNTLCGSKPVRWIAVWRRDRSTLELDAYDGERQPTKSDDAGFCASYGYMR